MYAYIKGVISHVEEEAIIIENNGIGYRLLTAPSLLNKFGQLGGETRAYTSLVLRENLINLYAFPSREECLMFELLQTVSGIGPKVAALILGSLSPQCFALAVLAGDLAALTQVKGLGKKGAERLILELKDKLKKMSLPAKVEKRENFDENQTLQQEDMQLDVRSALVVLGYQPAMAERIVAASFLEEKTLEENVRLALQAAARV